MKHKLIGIAALILYVTVIFAANWAILTFGLISIGFNILAPAGSFFAGMAFILRDIVQECLNKWITIGAIIVGAALSAYISTDLAIASGVAFLISELLDLMVYTPIRKYNFIIAVMISNIVGLLIDTFIFLQLANIPLKFAGGQIIAKLLSTGVFIGLYYIALKASKGYKTWLRDEQIANSK